MNFTHYDLGHLKRGSVVVVQLSGSAANVRLMDGSNFSSYQRGAQHRYFGGLAKQSPVRLGVPQDGRWHVTVDLMGLQGNVRSGVHVEPPPPAPLPPIPAASTQHNQLASIVENIDTIAPAPDALPKAYDVFISHASEDKDEIVRDLAHALQRRGLEVWYDEFALRIGDSLRRKIDVGLTTSRFGVVVLSPRFFAKNWSEYELNGLVTREMTGEGQIILPIWHDITREDLVAYSPTLADKVALRTADSDIEEIASEIAAVVAAPA
jgi:hypothetical protein